MCNLLWLLLGRKVFCSRPSCFKKLPPELGIMSPDRFCEWKRQVEGGVPGFTFICPHCRDEAACPGPQCAKRWKKRLLRANNKRGVGSKDDSEAEDSTPEVPMTGPVKMTKELLLAMVAGTSAGSDTAAEAASGDEMNGGHGGMNGNGNGLMKGGKSSGEEATDLNQSHDGMYAHPTMLQMQQAAVNGVPQQRSPTSLAAAGTTASYPTAAATFKPSYSVFQAGDPNAQPRTSMDVLAGVSNMGEVADGVSPTNGGNSATAESTPGAHQQLLQFLQQHQKQQEEQQQTPQQQQQQQQPTQSEQQSTNEAPAQPAATPAGYTVTPYTVAQPTTSPAASPAAPSAAAGQYAYNGGAGGAAGGQSFFTSPQLSPLMSPQPTALTVPSNIMSLQQLGNHTPQFSSNNSPSLAPLSPMTHNQSPATAFYSSTSHHMPAVPSLSLAAAPNGTTVSSTGEDKKSAIVEVGKAVDGHVKVEQEQSDAVPVASGEPVSVA